MDGRDMDEEVLSPICIFIDLFLIAISLSTVPIMDGLFNPFYSGYFCDDDTIRYPYKTSTVNDPKLYAFSFIIPLLTISALELRACRRDDSLRRRCVLLLGRALPAWLVQWLRRVFLYAYGLGCQEFLVTLAKFTIGRLRPHFMAVCQPNVLCNASGQDPHQYILDYKCANEHGFAALQSRLSFPSGHSAMAFYAAVFTVMYMEKRVRWPDRWMVVKTAMQTLVAALGWFTALSRIQDHKHHWGDVATGALLGTLVAWFWVERVMRVRGGGEDVAVERTSYASIPLQHAPPATAGKQP